jgi:hypothetical protein
VAIWAQHDVELSAPTTGSTYKLFLDVYGLIPISRLCDENHQVDGALDWRGYSDCVRKIRQQLVNVGSAILEVDVGGQFYVRQHGRTTEFATTELQHVHNLLSTYFQRIATPTPPPATDAASIIRPTATRRVALD